MTSALFVRAMPPHASCGVVTFLAARRSWRSHGESVTRPLFLSDSAVAALDSVEARVSQMCAWLLSCRAHARPCAVSLRGFERDTMTDADFDAALRVLACYPSEDQP